MSDKPLHVRVAESLGCKARRVGKDGWGCPCKDNAHGEWYEGGPNYYYENGREDTATLLRYDTDWSATGPLIEKYKIYVFLTSKETLSKTSFGKWTAGRCDYGVESGETPLVAICKLILGIKKYGKLDLDKSI